MTKWTLEQITDAVNRKQISIKIELNGSEQSHTYIKYKWIKHFIRKKSWE